MPPIMQSAADIAERDGVTKQAVTKRVRAFAEKHGLQVERSSRGAIVAFNVVQYDLLRERLDDPSKTQRSPADPSPPARDPESYEEALRQKTWYEAERKRIELDEQIGKLIRVDELATAVDECGAQIVAVVRRLRNEADAMATAIARDGAHGARVTFKQIEDRLLREIAQALSDMLKPTPAS